MAMQPALHPRERPAKRRSACDECRSKKLKCSGQLPVCARCAREDIDCVYSPQKQMGRPKKRLHSEIDEPETTQDSLESGNSRPSLAFARPERSDISGVSHGLQGFGTIGLEHANGSDESLPPWLAERAINWADIALGTANEHFRDGLTSMPPLTPDRSSHSPPLLNLPHESHPNRGQDLDLELGELSSLGANDLSSFLDLGSGLPLGLLPKCACLSGMYLTLSTLQTMDDDFKFPASLQPLREAMQTASSVLTCEECPKRFITGIQNVQLLATLLISIADRFSRILNRINAESARAELAGEMKKFRLADLDSSSTLQLPANDPGKAAAGAFSLNLSPKEWRDMCKKGVRAEVHGSSGGDEPSLSFWNILDRMEERQLRWHKHPPPLDFPKDQRGVPIGGPRHLIKKDDHLCLKLVGYAKTFVRGYDWS